MFSKVKFCPKNCNWTNLFHTKAVQNLPKFGIFGMKIYHLASPNRRCFVTLTVAAIGYFSLQEAAAGVEAVGGPFVVTSAAQLEDPVGLVWKQKDAAFLHPPEARTDLMPQLILVFRELEPILRSRVTTHSAVNFYNTATSLVRFGNKYVSPTFKKRACLLQHRLCSCEIRSRRGSMDRIKKPYDLHKCD
jgi:hypothetical protein